MRFSRPLLRGSSAVIVIALATALAACSTATTTTTTSTTSDGTTLTGGKTTYPLTIDNCGYSEKFTKAPSRVVILNGTSVGEVESFIVLGLQKSILANAQNYGVSDDPSMVAKINALPTGGVKLNANFDIAAETLIALKPDLVVSTWSGGFDAKSGFATREQLAKLGVRTLVNPVNCAFGNENPTPAEQAAYNHQSVNSSYQFLNLLGNVFNVQAKAAKVVAGMKSKIAAVENKLKGVSSASSTGFVAYPDMSGMNSNGLPAVLTGGIYNDILAKAGMKSSFPNVSYANASNISAEQLAAAKVDVLVLGSFMPGENLKAEADKLFKEYPEWQASKTHTYVTVSDGVWLGPLNAIDVEKIAKAAHPGAF